MSITFGKVPLVAGEPIKLFAAVPIYGGTPHIETMLSLQALRDLCAKRGIDMMNWYSPSESLITRGRNTYVHEFLKSGFTHCLSVDSDIVFHPDAVMAMIETGHDVVCGAYPRKEIDWENVRAAALRGEEHLERFAGSFVLNTLGPDQGVTHDDKGFAHLEAVNRCVPILDAATGFLLCKRQVFIDMMNAYPETCYLSDSAKTRFEPMHALFDAQVYEDRYLSEDYLFSRRWQKMGNKVWLYLDAQLGHIGRHCFQGDLSTMFETITGGASEWSDIPSLPDTDPQKVWHLYRYEWAAKRLTGKLVANAPCGANYGSPMLYRDGVERYVWGFDRSHEAANVARAKGYGEVIVCDIQTKTFGGFDAVVCLEGLEHLQDWKAFLSNLSGSVKELIASVPIIPTKHANPFHLHDIEDNELPVFLAEQGWTIKETEYQDEWATKAVQLVHAVRP
jgi:hypothetical protein